MSFLRTSEPSAASPVNPYLDRSMRSIFPKHLYTLFIAAHCVAFAVSSWTHPAAFKNELPHLRQVQHFADEDFDYHDEDVHAPTLWHFLMALPSLIIHIPPTIATLRLYSLAFALLFPAILTPIVTLLAPPRTPPAPWYHRVLATIRRPHELALILGCNPLIVLQSGRFGPELWGVTGVLLVWWLCLRGKHWIGAAVATVTGLTHLGTLYWVIFVLGWAVSEIYHVAPDKLTWQRGVPYLFTVVIWAAVWTQTDVDLRWSSFYDIVKLFSIHMWIYPLWGLWSFAILTRYYRWFIPFCLTAMAFIPSKMENEAQAERAAGMEEGNGDAIRLTSGLAAPEQPAPPVETPGPREAGQRTWEESLAIAPRIPRTVEVATEEQARELQDRNGGGEIMHMGRIELAWNVFSLGLLLIIMLVVWILE
ncbi:hypothetical protein IAT38_002321 [Cryptococcus sp. DSM 104549]